MKVTFLGVRGSTPCSGTNYEIFGGHTSCVMVEVSNTTILFDAGSGIVDATINKNESFILLSHTHLDHIMGIPFYKPIWNEQHKVSIFSGNLGPYGGIHTLIERTFSPPIFPISVHKEGKNNYYFDFSPKQTLKLGPQVTARTKSLNHPNGAIGYRLEYLDKSLCYITDMEHIPGVLDKDLVDFVQYTDLLIYDSSYDDENFHMYQGWGHSTWQEGTRLAKAAQAKMLAFFHHDPNNTDEQMFKLVNQSQKLYLSSFFARQGMVIDI